VFAGGAPACARAARRRHPLRRPETCLTLARPAPLPSRKDAPGAEETAARRSLPLRFSYALAVYFGRQPFLRVLSVWLVVAVVAAELLAQSLNALFGYKQAPEAVAVLTFLVTLLVSCPLILFGVDVVFRLERARQRRAESEARFRDGIDSMGDGFVMADPADRILLWNKAFERLFPSVAARLAPGMSLAQMATLMADGYGSFMDAPARSRRAQELVAGHAALDTPHEEVFDERIVTVVHSRTSEGGTVSVYRDVTRARQREAEFAAAKDEAERANHAKSHFLASMSHELRTPLNAVIGYSELLLEEAEGDGTADRHVADLKRINTAGRHLLALISDVLDLSKVEAGRMDIAAQPIDIDSFVAEVVSTAQPLVAQNGNVLLVNCGADLGFMVGDATKLRQVLLNLLGNAAKFTRGGRIGLTVANERREDGDWISFAVSDTGIGIDSEGLAKLFTAFSQADSSVRGEYGGTGLGLAVSQRLCWLMGGDISVASERGRGSCFTVFLPRSHVEDEAPRAAALGA
jgi:PAS domain S-box-containing protein